jgi:hypothetical protein
VSAVLWAETVGSPMFAYDGVLGANSTHPAIALVRHAISADASNGFLRR